ncbi:MAG: response regulator [Paracoccaceae bacterium]
MVEDEVLVRLDIVQSLDEAGFAVIEAASAEEAIALLDAGHDVDVLFSDVRLGAGLDGFALARHLRRSHPRVAIVMTSGTAALPNDLDDGRLAFLTKPYRVEAVLSHLAAAVARS